VIYATGDASEKVTVTVDQYESSTDASSAYQQAIETESGSSLAPTKS
jgi:hypothetical protein